MSKTTPRTAAKQKLAVKNIYEERHFVGVEDMILLKDISDAGILKNLTER